MCRHRCPRNHRPPLARSINTRAFGETAASAHRLAMWFRRRPSMPPSRSPSKRCTRICSSPIGIVGHRRRTEQMPSVQRALHCRISHRMGNTRMTIRPCIKLMDRQRLTKKDSMATETRMLSVCIPICRPHISGKPPKHITDSGISERALNIISSYYTTSHKTQSRLRRKERGPSLSHSMHDINYVLYRGERLFVCIAYIHLYFTCR